MRNYRHLGPNAVTMARLIAVPVLVVLMYDVTLTSRWVAVGVFTLAALSDLLDGYIARRWRAASGFGRIMDPIADKLLVTAAILMLVYQEIIGTWSLPSALIILCREILVSGLREWLAELSVPLPVTILAKWKTAIQMVALGFLIAGPAGELVIRGAQSIGYFLLWASAVLTLVTGWDYLRAGWVHGRERDFLRNPHRGDVEIS